MIGHELQMQSTRPVKTSLEWKPDGGCRWREAGRRPQRKIWLRWGYRVSPESCSMKSSCYPMGGTNDKRYKVKFI